MQDARTIALDAIRATIAEVNPQLSAEHRMAAEGSTVLAGEGGHLDSLGILNFLVALETRLEADYGRSVTLVGDEDLELEGLTVDVLADHLERAGS